MNQSLNEAYDSGNLVSYNTEPANLQELVNQIHCWDGDVKRVDPYFNEGGLLNSVGIWVDEGKGEYEVIWYYQNGRWHLSGDGAGDPSTNGGNVMTGRDLG